MNSIAREPGRTTVDVPIPLASLAGIRRGNVSGRRNVSQARSPKSIYSNVLGIFERALYFWRTLP